ncbi:hypothetical protein [uncultured Eudoraea sp.]|uniref:hypothetical protein n=1 Tax=uncultured Eudoraea sp. TaxID=1035614 RepID=UPI00263297F6|nr:hypothetical protein [uncultured Eudoraea sp.]
MGTVSLKEQQRNRFTFLQIMEGIEGILIIVISYLTLFLKPLRDRWGLSRKEAGLSFPGDHFVPHPRSEFVHAIEINAPARYVWPWIAQIGQGRGGFYSYEALENITGLQIYNSDKVLPEFQQPELGDLIPFGPKDACPIVLLENGKAMAIENWYDLNKNSVYNQALESPINYLHLSWLWMVEPLGEHRSRFVSRNRLDFRPSIKNRMIFGLLGEPVVFAMDRKMCYGIKRRAENLFRTALQ